VQNCQHEGDSLRKVDLKKTTCNAELDVSSRKNRSQEDDSLPKFVKKKLSCESHFWQLPNNCYHQSLTCHHSCLFEGRTCAAALALIVTYHLMTILRVPLADSAESKANRQCNVLTIGFPLR